MSKYDRSNATFGGYAVALGIVVAVVVAMALVVNGRQKEHIPSVDYRIDLASFSEEAPYPVYAPEGLPEGWVPTSSRLETGEEEGGPVTWTLGFATPEDRHAAFSMSNAPAETFITEKTLGGEPDGRSQVGGQTWERYYNEDESERSLVREEDGATIVVAGSSDYAELETLAGSLQRSEGER
ncbi:DUF4245 domain-containing protein [Marinactinospora thermotolerans]|uniref:DUF4245 domain-containing protein n=1 Tax=Marinactinospora thermotolerans DSM 45154 TaxID=1122192 RepID=A0A1T4SXS9_9ACTN|nr:DUF4245 domain-containing protein [Marinactinospora thermotolerans]SKA33054.1 Protein of unknown function [Marinactinospora thermotolerans DSM 45154]